MRANRDEAFSSALDNRESNFELKELREDASYDAYFLPEAPAAAFDSAMDAAAAPLPPDAVAAAFGAALDELETKAAADTAIQEATGIRPEAVAAAEAEATKAIEELSTLAVQQATAVDADTALSQEVDAAEAAKAIEELNAVVSDPAIHEQLRNRVASAGFLLRRSGITKARDWQIEFGPVWAPAGETTVITLSPQCDFRGEKIMATDTGAPRGNGTRIVSVMIGNRIQKLAADRSTTLTAFFAANSVANGIVWDTCPRSFQVQVTVSYVQTCTFDMTVFGKAVL